MSYTNVGPGTGAVKYVPSKKWRRFGKSNFRGARSLSRSLNHLFRRKNSYSLSARKNNRSAFEVINFSQGVSVAPLMAQGYGQAQVWEVRNSRAVEDLQFDIELDPGSKPKINDNDIDEDKSSNNLDDSQKDSGVATSGESESEEKKQETMKEPDDLKQDGCDGKQKQACTGEFPSTQAVDFRSRLQSVGSSQYNSDTLSVSQGCSYSSSPRDPIMSDWTSVDSLDSLDTSYWDLPIACSDSLSYGGSLKPRRYSESAVRDQRPAEGSPRLRSHLAHRRMSESWAVRYRNMYRRPSSICEARDSVSLREQLMVPRQEKDTFDTMPMSSASARSISETSDAASLSSQDTANISLKKETSAFKNADGIARVPQKQPRSMLQRSRSADSRTLQRAYKNMRSNSLIARRRAAFSDIESSDESPNAESNDGPNETIPRRIRHRNTKSNSLRAQSRSHGKLGKNSNASNQNQDFNPPKQASLSDSKDTLKDASGSSVEFTPVKDVMFCSGEHGDLAPGDNDMSTIIDAVQKEAEKTENAEKDMMVMFLVGKEGKIGVRP